LNDHGALHSLHTSFAILEGGQSPRAGLKRLIEWRRQAPFERSPAYGIHAERPFTSFVPEAMRIATSRPRFNRMGACRFSQGLPGRLVARRDLSGAATILAIYGNGGPDLPQDGAGGDLAERFHFRAILADGWHDIRQIGLFFAVPEFGDQTHNNKPASKLINARLAGALVVGGTDSTFLAAGRPCVDYDYVRVSTERDLTDTLERLSCDRAFYDAIAEAGWERRAEVCHEAVAERWLDVLEGPVAQDFLRWSEDDRRGRLTWLARALDLGRDMGTQVRSGLRKRLP
jgi:hypothetical protein